MGAGSLGAAQGFPLGWSNWCGDHVWWGCGSGGLRGAAPLPQGRAGVSPRHRPLLSRAVPRALYPASGCVSCCLRINWQLDVLFLLALSREMKLFMVLHVAEFVPKGYILEIIAANSNFLCHLSM